MVHIVKSKGLLSRCHWGQTHLSEKYTEITLLCQISHVFGSSVLSEAITIYKSGWQLGQLISLQSFLVSSAIDFHFNEYKSQFRTVRNNSIQHHETNWFLSLEMPYETLENVFWWSSVSLVVLGVENILHRERPLVRPYDFVSSTLNHLEIYLPFDKSFLLESTSE